ncbi:6379_t:CDS:2, partial [Entrophospora sp. SA101]
KNDTEIIPKVSDEIDISKTNNNTLQEILNMTPYLAQSEINMSSLIESNSQMAHSAESLIPPIGGIGAIPIVASTLMSPLSAYIFLILLIIVVMWFMILRRTWGWRGKVNGYRIIRKITMNINDISPATHALLVPEILENIFSHLSKDKDLFKIITVNHIWRSEGFRAI